jgi:YbgC/YbaW family acyl-CoA thioester hydrolase
VSSFSIKRVVQFAETDMAGIAHFANYFRWMEEVEHAFFRSLGLSVAMTHTESQTEIGWPRVHVACEYFSPLRFEDEIELRLRITKVGGKSLSYEVDFLLNGKPTALGKATSVCCKHTDGGMKAITIPPDIRDKLSQIASS